MDTHAQIELDEVRRLRRLFVDASTPVKNFLAWQEELIVRNAACITLAVWKKNQQLTGKYSLAQTPLFAYRLTTDARRIVRAMIRFVFDYLEDGKVPVLDGISLDRIHLTRDMDVWFSGLIIQVSTPELRSVTIDKLVSIIRDFVGENIPVEVDHLLNISLECAKAPSSRKKTVLMHPSIHTLGTRTSSVQYLSKLFNCHLNSSPGLELDQFLEIASHIPCKYKPWTLRITEDAKCNLKWTQFLQETCNELSSKEKLHFYEPIGVLLFMGKAVRRDLQDRMTKPRSRYSLDNVEVDLFVLFPDYMPYFVQYMFEKKYLSDKWMEY